MQVSQLDKDSLNFFLSRNPLMDLPSNTLYEETSNLLGHSQLDEFKRPIKSLELVHEQLCIRMLHRLIQLQPNNLSRLQNKPIEVGLRFGMVY